MTYSNPKVREVLSNLVTVQINTAELDAETKQHMREFCMVWTPTLVFFDHHGIEVRREVGYLEPEEFIAVTGLAQVNAELHHGEYAAAERGYLDLADTAHGDAAEEALFWAGVATLRSGSRERFSGHWQTLFERFPGSRWTSRSSFVRMHKDS